MTGFEFCGSYWWIFPAIMILLCLFFMRRCRERRWCRFGEYYNQRESAWDILKKRYAQGDIDQAEYDEQKRRLEL